MQESKDFKELMNKNKKWLAEEIIILDMEIYDLKEEIKKLKK